MLITARRSCVATEPRGPSSCVLVQCTRTKRNWDIQPEDQPFNCTSYDDVTTEPDGGARGANDADAAREQDNDGSGSGDSQAGVIVGMCTIFCHMKLHSRKRKVYRHVKMCKDFLTGCVLAAVLVLAILVVVILVFRSRRRYLNESLWVITAFVLRNGCYMFAQQYP